MRRFLLASVLLINLASPALAETIHVGVDGLVCAFCIKGIEKAFNENPATESIDVNMDEKLVTVKTKPDQSIDDSVLTKIITDAGYRITNIHRQK